MGINGKMSEIHAAMGLLQLATINETLERRAAIDDIYRNGLSDIAGLRLPPVSRSSRHNHAYFPVRIMPPFALDRDGLYQALKQEHIHTRRYFYPLITDTQAYRHADSRLTPNARALSEQVLCLPFYPHLALADQQRVIDEIRRHA